MMRSVVVSVAVLASVALACVPTTTITTTTVCCSPLTINAIPKVAPVAPAQNNEQCSVLRRISSTCPVDGLFVCTAAPDTNPSTIVVQAIDNNGNQLTQGQSNGGSQATLRIYCVNGVWRSNAAGTGQPVTRVSCSQSGSTGRDLDNVNAGGTNAG